MSSLTTSAALSVTPSILSESRQETSQNSSGFSISEYLTKLAKGGDTTSTGYQQNPTIHAGHYNSENLAATASSYSHPPPPPPTDSHHPNLPFNRVPKETDTNFWLRQQPPLPPSSAPNHNQHIEHPPITSWSRDGDPPPATSWPAPRPDIWSSEHRSNSWQPQSAALDPGMNTIVYVINLFGTIKFLYRPCN